LEHFCEFIIVWGIDGVLLLVLAGVNQIDQCGWNREMSCYLSLEELTVVPDYYVST